MTSEDPSHPVLYGFWETENSDFIVSMKENSFEWFSKDYLGLLTANFWGTGFDLYDYGLKLNEQEQKFCEEFLPAGFIPIAK